ncbi:hypothetical protein S7335_5090 [Synechococcus sp. PCC 7335]|uniref:hypothetical protein n=1 Tax=Synechococcus sp. (strain ATCC 29403 / PCC 7335) TaxID=91464 RepID=UPI00017EB519|nr:hypothetical protein [Synechococcus sp. PCC 7335]EDX87381.1 hypothetical protein S7335_5090 [Synechococcus sp. PCC 7335]
MLSNLLNAFSRLLYILYAIANKPAQYRQLSNVSEPSLKTALQKSREIDKERRNNMTDSAYALVVIGSRTGGVAAAKGKIVRS